METAFEIESIKEAERNRKILESKVNNQDKILAKDKIYQNLQESIVMAQNNLENYLPLKEFKQLIAEHDKHKPGPYCSSSIASNVLYHEKIKEFLETHRAKQVFRQNYTKPCYYGGTDFLEYRLHEFSKICEEKSDKAETKSPIIGFEYFMSCAQRNVGNQHRLEVFRPKKEVSMENIIDCLKDEEVKSREQHRRGILEYFFITYENKVQEVLFDLREDDFKEFTLIR